MGANFYIRKPNKIGFCVIELYFSYKGNELRFPTGLKVKFNHWNRKHQNIYTADLLAVEKNDRLRLIKNTIENIYLSSLNKGIAPNNAYLTSELNFNLNKPIAAVKTFTEHFKDFAELQKPPLKSELTYKKYKTVLRHLEKFQSVVKYPLLFENLNDLFYFKFTEYCTNVLKNNKNTISKHFKVLNCFLRWSQENKFYINPVPIKFKAIEQRQEVIFLTKDEFLTLYNAEIQNKRLSNVRDLFCFGCVTAIRYSAMQRLTQNNLQNGFIFYKADKSKKQPRVPLTEYAKQIIDKHNGNEQLLPQISNQKANNYLKELAEKLQLNRIVTQFEFKGNEKTEVFYKLYEKLSFKISKKTCVSLLFSLGVAPEIIGMFSANNPETLKHYLGMDNSQATNQYLDAFNNLEK